MFSGDRCRNCKKLLGNLPDLPSGERATCPHCDSTHRVLDEGIGLGGAPSFHMSTTTSQEDEIIRFDEAVRPDGLSSSASRSDKGLISYSVSGNSPQGEELLIEVCRRLVNKLNLDGANWQQPTKGTGVIDCEAADADAGERLQIQVVRAITDQSFWQKLSSEGQIDRSNLAPAKLASDIKTAIDKKVTGRKMVTPSARPGLLLALDATFPAGIAFKGVVEEFQKEHSEWASRLGFEAIWLVGPDIELIWRLDR